jgi:hypothetical protein
MGRNLCHVDRQGATDDRHRRIGRVRGVTRSGHWRHPKIVARLLLWLYLFHSQGSLDTHVSGHR